jgi:hypothetical protein
MNRPIKRADQVATLGDLVIMTSKQQDFRGHIMGVNEMQELVSIGVYKVEARSVRLVGPNGYCHSVHPSNADTLEGWQREAAFIWKLDDVVYCPPSSSMKIWK